MLVICSQLLTIKQYSMVSGMGVYGYCSSFMKTASAHLDLTKVLTLRTSFQNIIVYLQGFVSGDFTITSVSRNCHLHSAS